MAEDYRTSWEMSISRAEFERCLPLAIDATPRCSAAGVYEWGDARRGGSVRLEVMPALRIALLRIERHRVHLRIRGYDVPAFLKRWELYFRRGGG